MFGNLVQRRFVVFLVQDADGESLERRAGIVESVQFERFSCLRGSVSENPTNTHDQNFPSFSKTEKRPTRSFGPQTSRNPTDFDSRTTSIPTESHPVSVARGADALIHSTTTLPHHIASHPHSANHDRSHGHSHQAGADGDRRCRWRSGVRRPGPRVHQGGTPPGLRHQRRGCAEAQGRRHRDCAGSRYSYQHRNIQKFLILCPVQLAVFFCYLIISPEQLLVIHDYDQQSSPHLPK